MSVTAIIPTWNRRDLLLSILNNLREQCQPPAALLVVDNGSTDGSAALAVELGAEVISFPENRGFAEAVNTGITNARSEFVFIVNNDVILSRDWLQVAMTSASEQAAAFVVGKLLRPNGREIDGTWDLVSCGAYAWRSGYGKPDGSIWSQGRRIFWAPMTAALFRRSVFQTVGLLETRFESYYEDVDFGVRCALNNISGLYEPQAVATHNSKTTLGKRAARVYFYSSRNQVYLLARYCGPDYFRRHWWKIAIGQTLALFAAAKQRNLLPAIRGKWFAIRHWRSIRQEWPSHQATLLNEIFVASEQQILQLQKQTGFDLYWRLYFKLTGQR